MAGKHWIVAASAWAFACGGSGGGGSGNGDGDGETGGSLTEADASGTTEPAAEPSA